MAFAVRACDYMKYICAILNVQGNGCTVVKISKTLLFIWNQKKNIVTKVQKSIKASVKRWTRLHLSLKKKWHLHSETKFWHSNEKRNNFHNCYLLIYERFPRHTHSFWCECVFFVNMVIVCFSRLKIDFIHAGQLEWSFTQIIY